MPEALDDALDEVAVRVLDPGRLVRAVAAGRRRGRTPRYRRVELRPVELRAGSRLQVTTFDDHQAHTANFAWGDEAERVVTELLAEPFGNWHVDAVEDRLQLRVTKRGEAQLHRSSRVRESSRAHDRPKQRLVDPSATFLRELGISTCDGAVKARRADKYHQVEEFVRALRPVAPPTGRATLRVVDLGCGNAYLTFAAYDELHRADRPVALVGVDVKTQSRRHNEAVAERLGWADRVRFVEGSIADAELPEGFGGGVDVVMALHACDTATDDALARAVSWRAPLLLAAPCCHNDLQRRIRTAGMRPEAVAPILRYGLLRERQVDLLTDAWRALTLRLLGYRVDVIEFVDSRHTPRNVLLRATRTGARAGPGAWAEFHQLREAWGCQPYLADVLASELEAARDD